MKIDAHQHFWHYRPEEYTWINSTMPVLRHDFLPADLQQHLRAAGMDGVVSVQARQTIEETQWLLELAARHEWIMGVVGWLPLTAPDVEAHLERWAAHAKLKALRHVLHDEADDQYMLGADFNRGIEKLRPFKLVYDILILERHLPQTIEFVDRHPEQIFVLDHIAKPRIKHHVVTPWDKLITELALRPNVYCKLSGIITEADHAHWLPADIMPYLNVVLHAFGPQRLMFATDWPVCLLASSYENWVRTVKSFIAPLSVAEQQRIMGGTAMEAYTL